MSDLEKQIEQAKAKLQRLTAQNEKRKTNAKIILGGAIIAHARKVDTPPNFVDAILSVIANNVSDSDKKRMADLIDELKKIKAQKPQTPHNPHQPHQ